MFSKAEHKHPNILIVDDDPISRLLIADSLSELANIITASSGEEAIHIAKNLQPEVVLLDIGLPGISGFDVCKQLKNDPRTAHVSIIFVTSHVQEEIEQLSLSLGGIDFLTKPINLSTCTLRVKNHLQLQAHEKALKLAQKDMELLMGQLPVSISYWDHEWHNIYTNDTYGHWFGIEPADLLGLQLENALPSGLAEEIKAIAKTSTCGVSKFESFFDVGLQSRRHVQVMLSANSSLDQTVGYLLTIMDITTLEKAKQTLLSEKEKFRVTLNSIGDAVIAVDLERKISFINPIAEKMTGWDYKDAIGRHIDDVMTLQDATTKQPSRNPIHYALDRDRIVAMALNCQLVTKQGEIFRVEDSAAPIRDSEHNPMGAIIVFHDVSEAIAMAIKMNHMAHHDQLTDLPNRILLQDRTQRALKVAENRGTKAAFFLIDLDNFKYLNDSLGHQVGDEAILQLADRLAEVVDIKSTLARFGGDEFAIISHDLNNINEITNLTAKISSVFTRPVNINGLDYDISASVGISIYPDDAKSMDDLIRHADVAMYRAKHQGRSQSCYFSAELEEELYARLDLEKILREAIANKRLEVFYQSKVRLDSREIIGAEALVRMRDNSGKIISPVKFIPIAEETGLVIKLGEQVLRSACIATKQWLRTHPDFVISVNVAAVQLQDDGFCDTVQAILEETQIPPKNLQLEVTESDMMSDVLKCQAALKKLKALGLSMALDDFGTGYSSLAYLKKFHVDLLKIDRSFIRDMAEDKNDFDIVKAIVNLADSMELGLIAEGIESDVQAGLLLSLGCELGQGFMYSKPIQIDEFSQLLNDN